MKDRPSRDNGLRPATQARLLLRWIAVAVAAALVAATYYFFFSLPGSA